jgi:chitinase
MAKPILLIAASIPVIFAILIAVPMITNPQIPFTATNADDKISVEFTKQHLQKISLGVTDRITPQKTEILTISNEGDVRYLLTTGDTAHSEKKFTVERDYVKKLTAMIKETGFMKIPIDSILPNDEISEYDRFSLKVTLNGNTKQIHWVEQNYTMTFVPPIITQIGSELQNTTKKLTS